MATIQTPLTDLLGMRLPIMVAPMFLISNVEMLVAATRAGATGAVPSLNYRSHDEFRHALARLREEAAGPWGVNLMLMDNPRLREACVSA